MKTIKRDLKIKYEGKEYNIEYARRKDILTFKDDNGARIIFVKGAGIGIFVNEGYKKDLKKYDSLKRYNAYVLAPEQIKIFKKWLMK